MLLLGNNCNRFFWKLIVGEVFGILAKRNLSTNAILSPTGRSILSTTSDFGMVLSLVLIDIYVPFVSSPFLLFSLPFFCFIFFPQNHRMVEVGRELWRSSGPTLAAQVGTPRTSCPCSFWISLWWELQDNQQTHTWDLHILLCFTSFDSRSYLHPHEQFSHCPMGWRTNKISM